MVSNYLQTAKDNEAVFRSILRDLRDNRTVRPMGLFVPEDLDTEAELEKLFAKYSSGNRYGIFTITNFQVKEGFATIAFQDIAFLSGGGASLKYSVDGNDVQYLEPEFTMMS
ncbi:MAG: hypothetical protein WC668_00815 [Patescibacteria group bacterium]|jgi:hypothetical protein